MRRKNGKRLIILSIMLYMISIMLMACQWGESKEIEEEEVLNTVKLVTLSVEEGKQLSPKSYEVEDYSKEYLKMQSAYLACLDVYRNDAISLEDYQKKLDESGFNFDYSDATIYHKRGSFGRKNISIRNNPYIDRLSSEEKELLSKAVSSDTIIITQELLEMIDMTWTKILEVSFEPRPGEPYEIIYDVDAINDITAMNDALTFEIGYGAEYDSSGNIVSIETERKKMDFIMALKDEIELEISKTLNCHVKVFIKRRR